MISADISGNLPRPNAIDMRGPVPFCLLATAGFADGYYPDTAATAIYTAVNRLLDRGS